MCVQVAPISEAVFGHCCCYLPLNQSLPTQAFTERVLCVSAGLTRLLNASYNTTPEDLQGAFPVIVFSHG